MCGIAQGVGIPVYKLKAAMLVTPAENFAIISSFDIATISGVKILPSSYTPNTYIPYLNGLIFNLYINVTSLWVTILPSKQT